MYNFHGTELLLKTSLGGILQKEFWLKRYQKRSLNDKHEHSLWDRADAKKISRQKKSFTQKQDSFFSGA